jgi:hypothetical protein
VGTVPFRSPGSTSAFNKTLTAIALQAACDIPYDSSPISGNKITVLEKRT